MFTLAQLVCVSLLPVAFRAGLAGSGKVQLGSWFHVNYIRDIQYECMEKLYVKNNAGSDAASVCVETKFTINAANYNNYLHIYFSYY